MYIYILTHTAVVDPDPIIPVMYVRTYFNLKKLSRLLSITEINYVISIEILKKRGFAI
jgi:hypothetical protein